MSSTYIGYLMSHHCVKIPRGRTSIVKIKEQRNKHCSTPDNNGKTSNKIQ